MSRPLPSDRSPPDPAPPGCGPTLERIQAALDGTSPFGTLAADPHAAECASCRARARAARALLLAVPGPDEVGPPPADLTARILAGVRADRRARARQRVAASVGSLAAAVAVAVWLFPRDRAPGPPDGAAAPPAPVAVAAAGPAPAIRVADELARAGGALRESSRPLTAPADDASHVLAMVPATFSAPSLAPPAVPAEPIARSLAELPEAARAGLEPVTGSAQKAFARLLRDVGAMQPSKPKS